MSTIYNDKEKAKLLDGGSTATSSVKVKSSSPVVTEAMRAVEIQPESEHLDSQKKPAIIQDLSAIQKRAEIAMKLVDDIVLKKYVAKLSELKVVPCLNNVTTENLVLFKINKMVYEKDEYATDKFISVVSAMTFTDSSIYLIVDGHKTVTDFYMGIKCDDKKRSMSSVAETLKDSLLGQFPGAILEDYSYKSISASKSKQDKIFHRISNAVSISSCVGVPSYKDSKGEYTNANFIQGIEKFAIAMQGKEYTAVILASNVSHRELSNIRIGYENIYTELSAISTRQLAYSTNESLANALSRTKGYSKTTTENETIGSSESVGSSYTHTDGTSQTTTKTKSTSKQNGWGKSAQIGGPLMNAGSLLCATGAAAPFGAVLMGLGGIFQVAGSVGGKNISESTSNSKGENHSDANTASETHSLNNSHTEGVSRGEQFSETNGKTSTIGTSKNFTISIQDKHVQEVQKKIDKQLERIELCEGTGLWSTGAYFMSYDNDRATAEIGATIFRSIMLGEQSGVENSAINTWYPESEQNFKNLLGYLETLSHPSFNYYNKQIGADINLLPTSLLSSKELAIMLGLPRKSVPGLPVIEHVSLAKEVVRLNDNSRNNQFELGCIFDQGVERKANKVMLDAKSLTQHVFVTGSTGCGKSNTVYYLINQIRNQAYAPKFLIIEPAKGEYKDVFGNEHVYGTNPSKTPLLKINPFKFPKDVHVLEHIDRLIEIFGVCWPMYAAMPAVLKEAILNSYEDCGWDLYKSKNKYSKDLFPTFADLLNELILVISNSAYSEEVKSNYIGSLVTRVKSLNNGICKGIFSSQELGDELLFDENVIVDLSRIGSQETKSLIMGILIMRLSEYRSNSNISHNSDLRHITILEEAHNILKRGSQEQSSEGSNIAGKSVEMISNAIAEMRTYGEGFIIVDQSPGAVDISAIRNTNTKIIMRLPEESDRKVAGKASGMKDNQIDEISKLPTGVAVVYQNDWEEPVLCKIGKFNEEEIPFAFIPDENDSVTSNLSLNSEILKFLLKGRIFTSIEVKVDVIEKNLSVCNLSTFNKIILYDSIDEYKKTGELNLWRDNNFETLSRLVTEIVSAKIEVERIAVTAVNFSDLTKKLCDLVINKSGDLTDDLLLATSQCLMREYSLSSEVRKNIYSAWIQTVKLNTKII